MVHEARHGIHCVDRDGISDDVGERRFGIRRSAGYGDDRDSDLGCRDLERRQRDLWRSDRDGGRAITDQEFDDKIDLYHNNEMFPSLQNFSDFYFTMNNGVRFKILDSLTSGFQVTTRYNHRPPVGKTNIDNLYLLTLGYAFDTTREREVA